MKIIEVIADVHQQETIASYAEKQGALDCWYGYSPEDQRCSVRILVGNEERQTMLDGLQNLLGTPSNSKIFVLPVEAVIPRPDQLESSENGKKSVSATREELYSQIEKGVRLDSNFLILVFLSTVVAAIGLLENNIAVVIGAMVIAPLLGPNIALAFAATLGDKPLFFQSMKTNLVGLTFALILSVAIGFMWPTESFSEEILTRTNVGFDGVVLALASGAAAVLSLTTGVSSALVGVMVSVALLPPTATLGMMLAAGESRLAIGAALLLSVNVVAVNLSANLVFIVKGLRPRTWLEKRKANQSAMLTILFWLALLALLLFLLYLRGFISV